MELTDSTHQNSAPTLITIDLNEAPLHFSSDAPSPDAISIVRYFHDELTTPAGAPAELPTNSSACGVCGGTDIPYAVVCDGCERGFHIGCAGMGGEEVEMIEEWLCGECVSNGVESNRWLLGKKTKRKHGGVRFLDINALPPCDGEGEGREDSPVSRKHAPGDNSFGGNPFGVPVKNSSLLHAGNGFGDKKASGILTQSFKFGLEDISCYKHTVHRRFEVVQLPPLSGRLRHSNHIAIRIPPQNPSEMYLQALRGYILERQGVLGEGWRVEFKESGSSGELCPVYCSPDGKTFESMSEVACYLGLTSNCISIGTELRSHTSASQQRQLRLPTRRKSARLSIADGVTESKDALMSGLCKGQPSNSENVEYVGKYAYGVKVTGAKENSESESQQLNDAFPVQYEDFFILSAGRIDARPSYHDVNQIWPIGYRTCWHDKVTGSLFMCDVTDGGDSGPVFTVRRWPCSVLPIPNGSTVLCSPDFGKSDHQNAKENDDTTSTHMSYDDGSVLMFLSDPSHMEHDILSCLGATSSESFGVQKSDSVQFEAMPFGDGCGDTSCNNVVLGDEISELSVEEFSPSLAWRVMSKKLIDACYEIYKRSGSLKFFCKHVTNGTCSSYRDMMNETNKGKKFLPLAKFCGLSESVSIPFVIRADSALEAFSEELLKWLDQDRFGLDVEFVQEILEQLPGVQDCQHYVFLRERSNYSSSVMVGNGLLHVKTRSGVPSTDSEELDGVSKNCERSKIQMAEDPVMNDQCLPSGKPLSSRLPPRLVGDVLQVWEFLGRFYEVLGLKERFSFEELEEELINPWNDGLNLLEKFGTKIQGNQYIKSLRADGTGDHITYSSVESDPTVSMENPHAFIPLETEAMKEAAQAKLASVTYSRCTGSTLTKAHNSLLSVLIGDLQSKVAAVVDPHFDVGESKPKRGRKKDSDCWIATKQTKLNMLPCNELTWPELARRYILSVISMDGNLDSAEITTRESGKVFRCLQGDGGLLCGSLIGVAGIEADALLLAEATKKIFGSLNRGKDILIIDDERSDGTTSCQMISVNDGIVPEWALSLEPVRKLPTNVGARIKKCIYDALDKGPPEWAKKILEQSISKEVYKGNASGPTKRAVLSVLADVYGEGLRPKSVAEKRQKKFISISDIIMKQCRIVLRRAAAADGAKKFCNLLGRKLINYSDNDDEGILGSPAMVSRPLDFRTIDLRLAVGAYCGSHEAFIEDVHEVSVFC